MNGLIFTNFYVPEECLIQILSHLDDRTLLTSCNVVCKIWYNVIVGQQLWYQKLKNLRINYEPPVHFKKNFYRNKYLDNVYGQNLVKNNDGTNGLTSWSVESDEGGWIIEDPPKGCQPIPKQVGTTSCFATSYFEGNKYQRLHLKDFIPFFIRNKFKFIVECSEWYTHRFDCGSDYLLRVGLHDYIGRTLFTEDYVDKMLVEFVDCSKCPEWRQAKLIFKNTTKDLATVTLCHRGIDHNYWAGHYGSKMTGSIVRLKFT